MLAGKSHVFCPQIKNAARLAAERAVWPLSANLEWLEVRILHHQPLRALALEAHLHPCVWTVAFDIEDHAFAKLAVAHARTEPHAADRRLLGPKTTHGHRARDLHTRPHFFDELLGRLFDEARGLPVAVHPVQATLLGVGKKELLHCARHADVTQPALFLETVYIGERTLMRKEPVLHSAQKHDREFQALRAV